MAVAAGVDGLAQLAQEVGQDHGLDVGAAPQLIMDFADGLDARSGRGQSGAHLVGGRAARLHRQQAGD